MLLKCLVEHDVNTVFGYPGGAVLPIYDALYDMKGELNHVITAHEQGAAHAADGYARSTGKVGVVLTTSGPGATNTVTGIATAYMDSVPIIVIAGQVPVSLIGKDSFQEVNIRSITKAITKKTFIIDDVKNIKIIVDEAFKVAMSGRRGPVVIEMPKNIQNSEYTEDFIKTKDGPNDLCNVEAESVNVKGIDKALEIINRSKKPLVYAGGGVISSDAEKELYEFVDKLDTPVTCSLMGIGAFPGDRTNYTGMIGMHGSHSSNYAVTNCDLLIAIGARFSDRVVSKAECFAPNAKIIHIDIDEKEFGKNVAVNLNIQGDVKDVLTSLNSKLQKQYHEEWMKQILNWKKIRTKKQSIMRGISPRLLLEKLFSVTNGDCIVTTEVGQNQIWTAQYFKFLRPRTFITSGGLGTMGFGLGAAIGAAVGNSDKRVINIAGDGSFKMNSTELATISKYNLPIVQIILNNHALGMVHQWQELFYDGRFCSTKVEPDVDFVKLGTAYGIKSVKITQDAEIDRALEEAFEYNRPMIIECEVGTDVKVFPIIPPGEAIDKIIG